MYVYNTQCKLRTLQVLPRFIYVCVRLCVSVCVCSVVYRISLWYFIRISYLKKKNFCARPLLFGNSLNICCGCIRMLCMYVCMYIVTYIIQFVFTSHRHRIRVRLFVICSSI